MNIKSGCLQWKKKESLSDLSPEIASSTSDNTNLLNLLQHGTTDFRNNIWQSENTRNHELDTFLIFPSPLLVTKALNVLRNKEQWALESALGRSCTGRGRIRVDVHDTVADGDGKHYVRPKPTKDRYGGREAATAFESMG